MMNELSTVEEVARMYKVLATMVRKWAREGKVEGKPESDVYNS